MPKCTQKCQQNFFLALRIAYYKVLLPCYRMMKSGTFFKRSGAATKGFESCEFWFQVAFFNLITVFVFSGIICMYGRK